MSLQKNFLGALGFDPTTETSETSSVHIGDDVEDKLPGHTEYNENQPDLFLRDDHVLLLNDRKPGDFVTCEEEDWGHSRL